MGNENKISSRGNEDYINFIKDYEHIKKLNYDMIGEFDIYKNTKDNTLVMVLHRNFETEEEFLNFRSKTHLRKEFSCKFINNLIYFNFYEFVPICGDHSIACNLVFEFFNKTLLNQIFNNKNFGNSLNILKENDSSNLINSLFLGLNYLKEKGIYHGDIQPKYIYIDKNKEYKILDINWCSLYLNAYNKKLFHKEYKSTFSPTLLNSLKQNKRTPIYNKEKSDIWSFGITILSTIINENYSIFYDWYNLEIRYDIIKKKILFLKKLGYDSIIINLLIDLLIYDEKKRISYEEIQLYIYKNFQKFNFSNVSNIFDSQLIWNNINKNSKITDL